jgi:Rod binding domain-containing protein
MLNNLYFPDTAPQLKMPGDLGVAKIGSNANAAYPDEDAIKKVAAEFEAIFVNYMLKAMRNTVNKGNLFDRKTEEFYTSFLDQELSKVVASRGIGLAEMLVKEFKVSKPSIDNYV